MIGRTLVIGDLHGGLKALLQILERAEVTTEDEIIFLGDYVDGWGESFELIEFLIQLNKTHNCIFLLGNHDVWAEQYLSNGKEPVVGYRVSWKDRGGKSTMDSYAPHLGEDLHEHRKFFRTLHHFYEDLQNNRVFVHGGFTQGGGVRFENPPRNLWWDRNLLETAISHEQKYPGGGLLYEDKFPVLLQTYDEIFIGHSSTQFYGTIQPLRVCNLINMDTGGGHREGRLTIMDVNTKEFWQSDKLKELYPNDPHNDFMRNEGVHLN